MGFIHFNFVMLYTKHDSKIRYRSSFYCLFLVWVLYIAGCTVVYLYSVNWWALTILNYFNSVPMPIITIHSWQNNTILHIFTLNTCIRTLTDQMLTLGLLKFWHLTLTLLKFWHLALALKFWHWYGNFWHFDIKN